MTDLRNHCREFISDERGSAGLEFVATLPLLMMVLVMSYEYGEAFSTREALDSAVRDATRLLIRSPALAAPDGFGSTKPGLQDEFINRARRLVEERTGFEMTSANFPDPVVTEDLSGGELRTPFYQVVVTASIEVDLPLLGIFNGGIGFSEPTATTLPMSATDTARYLGAVSLGDTACSFIRNFHNRQEEIDEC